MVPVNHMLRPQLPSSNFFEAFLDFVTAAVAAEGIFGKSILDFVTSALAAEGIFVVAFHSFIRFGYKGFLLS